MSRERLWGMFWAESRQADREAPSVSEDSEMLGEGRAVEGKPRLSFAHRIQHLDAGEHVGGASRGLEAEHGPDAPLDGPAMSASTTRLTQRRGSIGADTARVARSCSYCKTSD